MPRHCRSGWHRMWPKRAFHDQNFLPHSLHGLVIFGAVGSGFLTCLGLEKPTGELAGVSIRTSLDRFRRGFSWRLAGVEEEAKKSPTTAVVVAVGVDTTSRCGDEMGNWRWKSGSSFIERGCETVCLERKEKKKIWGKEKEEEQEKKKKKWNAGGSVVFVGR